MFLSVWGIIQNITLQGNDFSQIISFNSHKPQVWLIIFHILDLRETHQNKLIDPSKITQRVEYKKKKSQLETHSGIFESSY